MSTTLTYQTDEANAISITNFSSDNLVYTTLNKSDEASMNSFANLNLQFGISEATINMWSSRGESGLPIRNFIVTEQSTNEPIGYVNLGVNKVTIQGKTLLEGGFNFLPSYLESTLVSEALNSVYIDYASDLSKAGLFQEPAFIYTISPDNPAKVGLENSNLKKLTPGSEDLEQSSLFEGLIASASRFSYDAESQTILESGNPKDVFFIFYDNSVCAAGEASGIDTESVS